MTVTIQLLQFTHYKTISQMSNFGTANKYARHTHMARDTISRFFAHFNIVTAKTASNRIIILVKVKSQQTTTTTASWAREDTHSEVRLC